LVPLLLSGEARGGVPTLAADSGVRGRQVRF
jgi:hypothetical protein